jgi:hypothetical protein
MIILGYVYSFFSNFLFLALVYFTLNLLEKYEQRTLVAILVLIYVAMRIVSALRSFHFRRCLERLEAEARRLATPVDSPNRREIVKEVTILRRAGESQSYMELMFLSLIVVLCCTKIVTG